MRLSGNLKPGPFSSNEYDSFLEGNPPYIENILGKGLDLPGGRCELEIGGEGIRSKEKGRVITPIPGFVIKTIVNGTESCEKDGRKLFINVCTHKIIMGPEQKAKLDVNGNEIFGLNVPVAVGETRVCSDRRNRSSLAVDCIVSPDVVAKIERDMSGSFRDFICQLVIQYVETKCSISLCKKYRLPNLKYEAYVDNRNNDMVVAKDSECASTSRQFVKDLAKAPKIEEVATKIEDDTSPKFIDVSEPLEGFEKNEKNPDIRKSQTVQGCKISMDLFIEEYGDLIPVLDFIQRLGKDRISLTTTPAEMFVPKPALSSKGTSQSFLLPLIASTISGSDGTRHIVISVRLVNITDLKVDVDISAFLCRISAAGHSTTDCALPFAVCPMETICTYDSAAECLVVRAPLTKDDTADPGSGAWLLARALEGAEQEYPPKPFVQGKVKDSTTDPARDSTKSVTTIGKDYEALPEDRFHASDVLSQHHLEQQRKDTELRRKKGERPVLDNTDYLSRDDEFQKVTVAFVPKSTKGLSNSVLSFLLL